MKPWQGLANQHGFIVACPDMVAATVGRPTKSNLGPSAEDDEVILAIYAYVCEHYNVNRRAVMITGFSGGGNPSYYTGLRHPEVFTHICTRGGNYASQHLPRDEALREAGREKLQIYIFYGEHDHPLIVGDSGAPGQARQAHVALTEAGYEHLTIEEVPGMKHESRPRKAAAWFAAYLADNAKRFKYGDQVDRLVAKAAKARSNGKTAAAVKDLLKARALESKRGLDPATTTALEALETEGRAKLDTVMQQRASDPDAALKALSPIARDYKGLAVGDEALALRKAWKG